MPTKYAPKQKSNSTPMLEQVLYVLERAPAPKSLTSLMLLRNRYAHASFKSTPCAPSCLVQDTLHVLQSYSMLLHHHNTLKTLLHCFLEATTTIHPTLAPIIGKSSPTHIVSLALVLTQLMSLVANFQIKVCYQH